MYLKYEIVQTYSFIYLQTVEIDIEKVICMYTDGWMDD